MYLLFNYIFFVSNTSFVTLMFVYYFFFQAEDGIRDTSVTGVQTCALPIYLSWNCRIGCAALDSAVPTQIVIDAVAVIFSVFLIMLRVLGDEVIQRKSIVTSNEVDAVDG